MPKPPKQNDPPSDRDKIKDGSGETWEEDQKKRGYYYDDAHGYEVYVPDEDEDDDIEKH